MQKITVGFWRIFIAFLTILMTACESNQPADLPQDNLEIPITGGIQISTSTTNTPDVVTSTPTPSATQSPPTLTPNTLPDVIQTALPQQSATVCNQASFIKDITIPDGTELTTGMHFQKIWRVENTGSCTWTPNYQIVFYHGDILGASDTLNLRNFVNPGQTTDITVSMIAPTANGDYNGYWKIMDPKGKTFGGGSDGNTALRVNINVSDTSTPLASTPLSVSRIIMNVDNSSVTADCSPGFPFIIYAQIITTQPGDVTYHWVFSNGTSSNPTTISIGQVLTQTVATTFTASTTGTYWAAIFNDSPNHQAFDRVSFNMTCLQLPILN
jgi:hypothetical protein